MAKAGVDEDVAVAAAIAASLESAGAVGVDVVDPTPDLHTLFHTFNEVYFWGKLAGCEVKWSPRMTLCAGLCSYEGRGGLCSIRLSEPLLQYRPRCDFVDTLLHEMIHAYLFLTDGNRDRDGHGPNFLAHAARINKAAGSNITVYHNFKDEVDVHRTHWWKCSGPCQHKPPYFGIVKRAMNRPPHPRDYWWARHQAECGGEYVKIKSPPPKPRKKRVREKAAAGGKRRRTVGGPMDAFVKGKDGGKAAAKGGDGGTTADAPVAKAGGGAVGVGAAPSAKPPTSAAPAIEIIELSSDDE